jgi:putative transposase
MTAPRAVLHAGDRISFGGDEHQVVEFAGTSVRLRADSGGEQVGWPAT